MFSPQAKPSGLEFDDKALAERLEGIISSDGTWTIERRDPLAKVASTLALSLVRLSGYTSRPTLMYL